MGYLKNTILPWPRQHAWHWRLLPLAYVCWTFYKYVTEPEYIIERTANFFSGLDFGMHELGHLLFRPFGDFMYILGGSLFQCMFPVMWLAAFWYKKSYFAASMCLCWLGFNLYDVALYAADSRYRILPLVSLDGQYGTDSHDWFQILSRTGHLQQDIQIGNWMRIAGLVCILLGLLLGVTLLGMMFYAWLARRRGATQAAADELASRLVLNVQQPYFDDIVLGRKTLEGRLAKPKILDIMLGDKIDFECNGQTVTKTVVTKYPYPNFEAAFQAHDFHAAIPEANTLQEALASYEQFYSRELQDQMGVILLRII